MKILQFVAGIWALGFQSVSPGGEHAPQQVFTVVCSAPQIQHQPGLVLPKPHWSHSTHVILHWFDFWLLSTQKPLAKFFTTPHSMKQLPKGSSLSLRNALSCDTHCLWTWDRLLWLVGHFEAAALYAAQDSLELKILLPSPSNCWDCRSTSPAFQIRAPTLKLGQLLRSEVGT